MFKINYSENMTEKNYCYSLMDKYIFSLVISLTDLFFKILSEVCSQLYVPMELAFL